MGDAAPNESRDLDVERVTAAALAAAGDRQRAEVVAARYAQACATWHRSPFPLVWPRRTAGRLLRVGVLLRASDASIAARLPSLAGVRDVECVGFKLQHSGSETADAATKPADNSAIRGLPADPAQAARTLATLDLDVIVDTAGVHEAYGPVLARRPARCCFAIAGAGDVPLVALVDRVFGVGADGASGEAEFARALVELRDQVAAEPTASATAAELAAHFDAAVRAHRGGDRAVAKAGYDALLIEEGDCASLRYLRGMLARDEHDLPEATSHLAAAVRLAPQFADARVALANAMIDAGDPQAAADIAASGLAFPGTHTALWRALGNAALKRRDGARAAAAFAEVLARDPADAEAHYNHGVALQMAGDVASASESYRRALALQPDLVDARFNLGVVEQDRGATEAAIGAFSQVLERDARHVAAYQALSEALLRAGRLDAWFANFARFEQACPGHVLVAAVALEVAAFRGDFALVGRYLGELRRERLVARNPGEMLDGLQQLLHLLLYFDVEPDLAGRLARMHDRLARSVYGEPWPRRTSRRPGKLRIGYLSGDLRNHVMGKMTWQLLRHHDRDRFDVFGYSTTVERDAWTDRIVPLFTRFANVAADDDFAAASAIAADDLDVLVDLSTHTKGSRPGILALKPARVQITHIASAGATALSAIDFKLTDRYADVADDPRWQIEAPLVMEGCVYPWRAIDAPRDDGRFSRQALGIAQDATVVGAFSTPLKLSQRCLALWRQVLENDPHALLAFSPLHPGFRGAYAAVVRAAGIDPRRIAFIPQGRDDAENQARYRVVDFVLDPMPYGGVNGTQEALAMRVPVVTLVGSRHGERSSYSMLANLGVTQTIAHTGGDYVAIAARLAREPAFMREVRDRIASALASSPLTNVEAHTRHLEAAYVQALAQRAPDALVESLASDAAGRRVA
jgi:predicted O-linked N-acetylglucosamine transferase (SPINDLY family)